MMNKLFKSVAIALAAVTFSLPLSGTALAAASNGHRNAKPASSQRVMQRTSQKAPTMHKAPIRTSSVRKAPAIGHKGPVVHRSAPRPVVHRGPAVIHRAPAHHDHGYYHHHSSTGNFVTGAIIGAILGAVIANNTSSDY